MRHARCFHADHDFPVNIISVSTQMAQELIVLLVTWLKTYRTMRQAHTAKMGIGLSTVLFRDSEFALLN